MAARLNRRHTEMVLKKIQASQLINRLQDHALGEVDMKDSQIRAADILLKKVLADQRAVEHSGEIRRKAPNELTMAELDERIARVAAREEAQASGAGDASAVH